MAFPYYVPGYAYPPQRPAYNTARTDYPAADHLYPGYGQPAGGEPMYRSHSHGHGARPTSWNEHYDHSPRRSHSRSPRGRRTGDYEDEEIMRRLARLQVEEEEDRRRSRSRSRSRGHSDADLFTIERLQHENRALALQQRDWQVASQRTQQELWDLKHREEEAKEQKRRFAEYEAKKVLDEEHDKQEKERLILDYKNKLKAEEKKQKAEEKRIKEKLEMEEFERKEKEKKEWAAFLAKQSELQEKEKEEKKKEKEKVEEATRQRLFEAGFSHGAIERMLDEDKNKNKQLQTRADIRAQIVEAPSLGIVRCKAWKLSGRYVDQAVLERYRILHSPAIGSPGDWAIHQELSQDFIDQLHDLTLAMRARAAVAGAGGRVVLETNPRRTSNRWSLFPRRRSESRRRNAKAIVTYHS